MSDHPQPSPAFSIVRTSADDDESDTPKPGAIHITLPPRLYQIPLIALSLGCAIGIMRGGRSASLRFLAENAHNPPKTVQGWYFYKKTKNYRVMLGGLKGAAKEGGRLGAISGMFVGIEEGMEWWGSRMSEKGKAKLEEHGKVGVKGGLMELGVGGGQASIGRWIREGKEVGAGLGTAGVVGLFYRGSWKRIAGMGLIMGITLKLANSVKSRLVQEEEESGIVDVE